jgi:hypothetical protein
MSLWLRTGGDLSIELVNVLPIFVNLIQALSSWLGDNSRCNRQQPRPLELPKCQSLADRFKGFEAEAA